MKVSLQQITVPGSSGTVNVTDSNISSDWQGAIIWGGTPSVSNTVTANTGFYIGAVDSGGRNLCIANTAQDAASSAQAAGIMSNSACALFFTASAGINASSAYSATLSNGFTLQSSAGAFGKLANVMMFAGSDVQFGVASAHLAAAATSATITHNLSVVPDVVIVLGTMGPAALGTGSQNNGFSIGFYDNTNVNSIGAGAAIVSGAATTSVGARCGTATVGEQVNTTPANSGNWSVSSINSSTITLARGDSAIAGNVGVICIGHNPGTNVAVKAYADTTPTSTGANTPVTGMVVAPQAWLNFSTRLTSTSFANTDAAGSWGLAGAVNNNGTAHASSFASAFENGVATSVGKSFISTDNTTASLTLASTGGTTAFASTFTSWNSGGFTENVTTAGSGWERINLTFGMQVAPATPAILLYERRYVHFYST